MLITSSMNVIASLSPTARDRTLTGKSDYVMILFAGSRPLSADLSTLISKSAKESVYDFPKLAPLLTKLGASAVITHLNTKYDAVPVTWADSVEFKFSALPDKSPSLSDTAPTWGLLGYWARFNSSDAFKWQVRSLLYFTVGNQDSAADMRIQGGVIPKGVMWKPNDIALALTGAVN